MKVKILRTVGRKDTLPKDGDNPTSLELPVKPDGTMYVEGEVAELKKDDAEKFIVCGMGEQTDEPVGLPPKPWSPTVTETPTPVKAGKGEK